MKLIFGVGISLALTVFTTPAHAFLEARMYAGLIAANPTSMNDRLNTSDIDQFNVFGRHGVDGIVRLPGSKFGLGARYDWQGVKTDASRSFSQGNEFELSATRIAALLSYRFVDKRGYVGLIGTFGVQHKPTIRLKESGVVSDYDSGKSNSTSISADGGVRLGPILLGGEIGFQDYIITDVRGPGGNATFHLNLSGLYGAIHLGVEL